MIFHYWNKINLLQFSTGLSQLFKLDKVTKNLLKEKAFKTLSVGVDEAQNTIKKLKRNFSYFKLEARLEDDMTMIFWGMIEIIKTCFLLEPHLLFNTLKRLDSKRDDLAFIFQYVGTIASLLSTSLLRASLPNYCIPQYCEENTIEASNAFHPLFIKAIPNSFKLDKKSMLITGSNMSGKTSFIRTVAINALTAQTINTCFAEQMRLPP